MEITDAKYQELITDQARVKTLEAENAKMATAAENTAIALKEGREKIAAAKAAEDAAKTELETFKTSTAEELKKLEGIDEVKAKADKWANHEKTIADARKAGIEDMKTKLGADFLKANESFLDGLPEDKVETYLKNHVTALDGGKRDVVIGTDGKPVPTTHTTEFDTAIAKGDFM